MTIRLNKGKMAVFGATAVLVTLLCASAHATILRVAPYGNGSDGSTWAKAYKTISQAVQAAPASSEIWVCQGTYAEGVTVATAGVGIYGGFAGDEATRDARHGSATIVDGQSITRPIKLSYADNTTLDGLTVQNGNAVGFGGGVCQYYCNNVVMNNCVVQDCTSMTGNNGGGISITMGSATMTNVTIQRCATIGEGGGLKVFGATINATGLCVTGCTAVRGGGLKLESGSGSISQSVFAQNVATSTVAEGGGGARMRGVQKVLISRNFFYGNVANYGAGLDLSDFTTTELSNNIISSNHSLTAAAIYIHGASCWPQMFNNTVADNVADVGISAYYIIEGGGPRFRNEVVAYNRGPRGAIGHDATGAYEFGYSDVWCNTPRAFDDTSDPAASAVTQYNPKFLSRTFLNIPLSYMLAPESGVLDYGQNRETIDIAGAPRPINARGFSQSYSDEGAFEYQAVAQHVHMDLWSGPNKDADQSTVLLSVRVTRAGVLVSDRMVPQSPNGFYVLSGDGVVGDGPFDVWLSAPGYLRKKLHLASLPAYASTGVDVGLMCGDTNGDNTVNLVDLSQVLSTLGTSATGGGDVNGDGAVGITDLSAVLQNFMKSGDPY